MIYVPFIVIPFSKSTLRSFIKQESLACGIYLSIYLFIPHATTKNNGFHPTRSNGQKNGFATKIPLWKEKASSAEQTLAFP
jgi:hypothetical protein